MFLSSGILMAIALVYFVAGVGTEKLICQSLKNPHNSRTFTLLDQLTNVNRFYVNAGVENEEAVNLRTIIRWGRRRCESFDSRLEPKCTIFVSHFRTCHRNESLYRVLQLDKQIDINEIKAYPKKYRIDEQIRELVDNIKLDYEISIITPDADRMLQTLANSKLNNINFPAYTNVVVSEPRTTHGGGARSYEP